MSPSRGQASLANLLHRHARSTWTGCLVSKRCVPIHVKCFTNRSTSRQHYSYAQLKSQIPLDVSLFEAPSIEYEDHVEANEPQGPTQLLLETLQHSVADATKTLTDLVVLETPIEPHTHFAQAVLECVRADDLRGSFMWLNYLPVFNIDRMDTRISIHDAPSQLDHNLSLALTHFLQSLIARHPQPDIVCIGLIHTARLRGLEADDTLCKAFSRTLSWVLRHAHSSTMQSTGHWTWALWQNIVNHAFQAQRKPVEKGVHPPSSLPSSPDGKFLARRLERVYNQSIRTLLLSRKYEAALYWLERCHWFQFQETEKGSHERRTRKLKFFTWKMFVETVLVPQSAAPPQVISDTKKLVDVLKKRLHSRADARWNAKLTEKMITCANECLSRPMVPVSSDKIHKERTTPSPESSSTIAKEPKHSNMRNSMPTSSLDELGKFQLPKASTVALMLDRPNIDPSEFANYLDALKSCPGAQGLSELGFVLHKFHVHGPFRALEEYCLHFEDRNVLRLSRIVLSENDMKTLLEISEQEGKKLWTHSHANVTALRCLVLLCKGDVDKLLKVYHLWLELIKSAAHVDVHSLPKLRNNETVLEQGDMSSNSVFEAEDQEYTVAGVKADDQSHFSVRGGLVYQLPPLLKPNVHHFNVFMTALPRAALRTAPSKSPIHVNEESSVSLDVAFTILNDMKLYGVQPSISTWTLLLETIALSSSAGAVDESDAIQNMSPLLIALGMRTKPKFGNDLGESVTTLVGKRTKKIVESLPKGNFPQATPLTYSALIVAFLRVPPTRGGPLVHEAKMVLEWLSHNEKALGLLEKDSGKYGLSMQRAQNALHRAEQDMTGVNNL